jgi:hypothetical protein
MDALAYHSCDHCGILAIPKAEALWNLELSYPQVQESAKAGCSLFQKLALMVDSYSDQPNNLSVSLRFDPQQQRSSQTLSAIWLLNNKLIEINSRQFAIEFYMTACPGENFCERKFTPLTKYR